MLVYANAFRVKREVTPEQILSTIARWLGTSRHEIPRVTVAELLSDGRFRFKSGATVEITTTDGSPNLYSLRYRHSDNQVAGREWFSEIGVEHSGDRPCEVSVVVRTDEISSRVTTPITASRPGFVSLLASSSFLDELTPGLDVKTLDGEHAAEALRVTLDDPTRTYAYVIVSPNAAGEYAVAPEIVRSHLVGLAEVVQIPARTPTFAISDALGKDYSAWGGAITIVLAPRGDSGSRTIKLLPNQLTTLQAEGNRPEFIVLEAVVHRSNPIFQARHISPGKVRDAKQRRELSRRKEEAAQSGDLSEYAKLLEEDNERLRRGTTELEERLLNEQISHEDDLRTLRYENDSIKLQMDHLASNRPAAQSIDGEEQFRNAVFAAIAGEATPEQSLLLVEQLFPDRVEILPSAYKSARTSREFQHRQRAFELLRKLATDYYDSIATEGKGDAQARQIFGNAYSATESEPVENNKRARELRTFDHHGVPVEMMQHLKIGVKDSAAETLRIHFEWDSSEQKIIIGHCGPHLPFR